MKCTLKVIFGKEQVIKAYNDEHFTDEETKQFVKEFEFGSLEEKLAFTNGLKEAVGWIEICIPELELSEA